MKTTIIATLILLSSLLFFSCSKKTENSYTMITQEQAKKIMDTEEGFVILDVRTLEEYESGHIPNAILLPYDEIPEKAESVLKDKNQKILVYCRSGNRSKTGSSYLVELGYTNVYEFGGINTWPYEIEN